MEDEENILADFLKAKNSKDLWYNFESKTFETDANLRAMVKQGLISTDNISSVPDIFPIFGDMDLAVDFYLPGLVEYVKRTRGESSPLTSPIPEEETEEVPSEEGRELVLHKGLRGFHNPTDYCFMDSTLLAMFALRGSPFYTHLIEKDYQPGGNLLCGSDASKDTKIRRDIQRQLREDVASLLKGKARYTCSRLRTLIGKDCRTGNMQDLSDGMHDPSEFYSRLMDALNYEPMVYTEFREKEENGVWKAATVVRPTRASHLTLRADSTDRIMWPESWNPVETEIVKIGDEEILTRSRTTISSADVFVVHLDRRDYEKSETYVNDVEVPVEEEFRVELSNGEERVYSLGAVVYTPHNAHYHCMVKSKGKWYDYNDLKTTQIIEMSRIPDEKAIRKIWKRGSLFVYF